MPGSPLRANKMNSNGYQSGMKTPVAKITISNYEEDPAVVKLSQYSEINNENISRERWIMGTGYMFAMGVCGLVLVALGSTLDDLASNIGMLSTSLGSVFIARGIGAILGAISSAKLYRSFPGNIVMTISLALITALLCILPFNKSYELLHVYFLLLGLNTAITDTGCQIMTRKLHGRAAGPWLGANTVAFGISGALVPIIEILTSKTTIQYYIISVIVGIIALWIGAGPNSEKKPQAETSKGNNLQEKLAVPHYYVEIIISIMVFCLIGGKVTSTAYLDTYVDQTGVIDESNEPILVLVLWIAITVGRLVGVYDQRYLTNKTLPLHLSILLIGGFLSATLVLSFPKSGAALWTGVAFYGLFNGPCVGYCYDYNNRCTYPTEKSMSIVMFGLNFGASLVPYITTVIWVHGGGPVTLIGIIFLSMFIPLPLLHVVKYFSYDATVNPIVRTQYASVPQEII